MQCCADPKAIDTLFLHMIRQVQAQQMQPKKTPCQMVLLRPRGVRNRVSLIARRDSCTHGADWCAVLRRCKSDRRGVFACGSTGSSPTDAVKKDPLPNGASTPPWCPKPGVAHSLERFLHTRGRLLCGASPFRNQFRKRFTRGLRTHFKLFYLSKKRPRLKWCFWAPMASEIRCCA